MLTYISLQETVFESGFPGNSRKQEKGETEEVGVRVRGFKLQFL